MFLMDCIPVVDALHLDTASIFLENFLLYLDIKKLYATKSVIISWADRFVVDPAYKL